MMRIIHWIKNRVIIILAIAAVALTAIGVISIVKSSTNGSDGVLTAEADNTTTYTFTVSNLMKGDIITVIGYVKTDSETTTSTTLTTGITSSVGSVFYDSISSDGSWKYTGSTNYSFYFVTVYRGNSAEITETDGTKYIAVNAPILYFASGITTSSVSVGSGDLAKAYVAVPYDGTSSESYTTSDKTTAPTTYGSYTYDESHTFSVEDLYSNYPAAQTYISSLLTATSTNEIGSDAGTYTGITISANSDANVQFCKWSVNGGTTKNYYPGYTDDDKVSDISSYSYSWTIAQATITSASVSNSSGMNYEYGGDSTWNSDLSVNLTIDGTTAAYSSTYGGTLTYYWSDSNTNSGGTGFTSSTELSAGTYYIYATITGMTNYEDVTTEAQQFTVKPALTAKKSTTTPTYGTPGTVATLTASGGNSYTYTITSVQRTKDGAGTSVTEDAIKDADTIENYFAVEGATGSDSLKTTATTLAGTYTVKVKVTCNSIKSAEMEVSVTVGKATYSRSKKLYYDKSEFGSVTVKAGVFSTWSSYLSVDGEEIAGAEITYSYQKDCSGDYLTLDDSSTIAAGFHCIKATIGGNNYITAYTGSYLFIVDSGTSLTLTAQDSSSNNTKTPSVTYSTSDQTITLAANGGAGVYSKYEVTSQKDSNNQTVEYFSIKTSSAGTLTVAAKTPAGTYTVVAQVTGTKTLNNQTVSQSASETLTIKVEPNPVSPKITISGTDISQKTGGDYIYTGCTSVKFSGEVTPTVNVYDGETLLTAGTDYTLGDWDGNNDFGVAKATITFTNNYTGTATARFGIEYNFSGRTSSEVTMQTILKFYLPNSNAWTCTSMACYDTMAAYYDGTADCTAFSENNTNSGYLEITATYSDWPRVKTHSSWAIEKTAYTFVVATFKDETTNETFTWEGYVYHLNGLETTGVCTAVEGYSGTTKGKTITVNDGVYTDALGFNSYSVSDSLKYSSEYQTICTLTATGTNASTLSLTWTLLSGNNVVNMTVSDNGASATFSTNNTPAGTYKIKIKLTDGTNTITETIKFTVAQAEVTSVATTDNSGELCEAVAKITASDSDDSDSYENTSAANAAKSICTTEGQGFIVWDWTGFVYVDGKYVAAANYEYTDSNGKKQTSTTPVMDEDTPMPKATLYINVGGEIKEIELEVNLTETEGSGVSTYTASADGNYNLSNVSGVNIGMTTYTEKTTDTNGNSTATLSSIAKGKAVSMANTAVSSTNAAGDYTFYYMSQADLDAAIISEKIEALAAIVDADETKAATGSNSNFREGSYTAALTTIGDLIKAYDDNEGYANDYKEADSTNYTTYEAILAANTFAEEHSSALELAENYAAAGTDSEKANAIGSGTTLEDNDTNLDNALAAYAKLTDSNSESYNTGAAEYLKTEFQAMNAARIATATARLNELKSEAESNTALSDATKTAISNRINSDIETIKALDTTKEITATISGIVDGMTNKYSAAVELEGTKTEFDNVNAAVDSAIKGVLSLSNTTAAADPSLLGDDIEKIKTNCKAITGDITKLEGYLSTLTSSDSILTNDNQTSVSSLVSTAIDDLKKIDFVAGDSTITAVDTDTVTTGITGTTYDEAIAKLDAIAKLNTANTGSSETTKTLVNSAISEILKLDNGDRNLENNITKIQTAAGELAKSITAIEKLQAKFNGAVEDGKLNGSALLSTDNVAKIQQLIENCLYTLAEDRTNLPLDGGDDTKAKANKMLENVTALVETFLSLTEEEATERANGNSANAIAALESAINSAISKAGVESITTGESATTGAPGEYYTGTTIYTELDKITKATFGDDNGTVDDKTDDAMGAVEAIRTLEADLAKLNSSTAFTALDGTTQEKLKTELETAITTVKNKYLYPDYEASAETEALATYVNTINAKVTAAVTIANNSAEDPNDSSESTGGSEAVKKIASDAITALLDCTTEDQYDTIKEAANTLIDAVQKLEAKKNDIINDSEASEATKEERSKALDEAINKIAAIEYDKTNGISADNQTVITNALAELLGESDGAVAVDKLRLDESGNEKSANVIAETQKAIAAIAGLTYSDEETQTSNITEITNFCKNKIAAIEEIEALVEKVNSSKLNEKNKAKLIAQLSDNGDNADVDSAIEQILAYDYSTVSSENEKSLEAINNIIANLTAKVDTAIELAAGAGTEGEDDYVAGYETGSDDVDTAINTAISKILDLNDDLTADTTVKDKCGVIKDSAQAIIKGIEKLEAVRDTTANVDESDISIADGTSEGTKLTTLLNSGITELNAIAYEGGDSAETTAALKAKVEAVTDELSQKAKAIYALENDKTTTGEGGTTSTRSDNVLAEIEKAKTAVYSLSGYPQTSEYDSDAVAEEIEDITAFAAEKIVAIENIEKLIAEAKESSLSGEAGEDGSYPAESEKGKLIAALTAALDKVMAMEYSTEDDTNAANKTAIENIVTNLTAQKETAIELADERAGDGSGNAKSENVKEEISAAISEILGLTDEVTDDPSGDSGIKVKSEQIKALCEAKVEKIEELEERKKSEITDSTTLSAETIEKLEEVFDNIIAEVQAVSYKDSGSSNGLVSATDLDATLSGYPTELEEEIIEASEAADAYKTATDESGNTYARSAEALKTIDDCIDDICGVTEGGDSAAAIASIDNYLAELDKDVKEQDEKDEGKDALDEFCENNSISLDGDERIAETLETIQAEIQALDKDEIRNNLTKNEGESDSEFEERVAEAFEAEVAKIVADGENKLVAAEFRYDNLVTEESNSKVTASDKDALAAAKTAYEALTEGQKAAVDALYQPGYPTFADLISTKEYAIDFNEERADISEEINGERKAHDGVTLTTLINNQDDYINGDNFDLPDEYLNDTAKSDWSEKLETGHKDAIEAIECGQKVQQAINQLGGGASSDSGSGSSGDGSGSSGDGAGNSDGGTVDANSVLGELINSGAYSETAADKLKEIYEEAKEELEEITTSSNPEDWESAIAEIKSKTEEKFAEVDVVSISTSGVTPAEVNASADSNTLEYGEDYNAKESGYIGSVSNDSGMSSTISLIIEQADGNKDKANSIKNAVKNNTAQAAAGSELTATAIEEALYDKEVKVTIDAYLMQKYSNGESAKIDDYDGTQYYKVRVLIPTELRGVNGLQVVYVADDGSVQVYDTTIEGNYLVFTTTHFSEFQILGETSVNLLWVVILLCVAVLAEIAAIIIVNYKRRKAATAKAEGSRTASDEDEEGSAKNEPVAAFIGLGGLLTTYAPSGIIPAIIVLGVIVVALGGVIAYVSLRKVKAKKRVEKSTAAEDSAKQKFSIAEAADAALGGSIVAEQPAERQDYAVYDEAAVKKEQPTERRAYSVYDESAPRKQEETAEGEPVARREYAAYGEAVKHSEATEDSAAAQDSKATAGETVSGSEVAGKNVAGGAAGDNAAASSAAANNAVYNGAATESGVPAGVAAETGAAEAEEDKPVVFISENGGKVFVMYDYSLKARLIQSDEDTQRRHHEIKEYFLSYGLKCAEGRKAERYYLKGKTYAKMAFRGKTLCVNLAVSPDSLDGKYRTEDVSGVKKYADVPCLYRIKNEKRCAYCKQIADVMLTGAGLTRTPNETPCRYLPYETREQLVEDGLVRMKATAESGEEILPADFAAMKESGFIAVGGISSASAPEAAEEEVSAAAAVSGEALATAPEEEQDDETKPTVFITSGGRKVYVVYDYSFKARLIQSDEDVQTRYYKIKERLLSYGLKCGESWKAERFYLKGKTYAKMTFRGRTLCVNYAASPAKFENSKYKVEDVSDVKKYADIPCLYRIKNERRAEYANRITDEMLAESGLTYTLVELGRYIYPYETRDELVEKKLVRMKATAESGEEILPADLEAMQSHSFINVGGVRFEKVEHITATEAAAMSDEIVAAEVESDEYSTGRNKGIVNIDRISEKYSNGETVTVANLRERGLIPKKVDYVKILARGTLDKALIVKAQEFSTDAVKMIVLVGGTAVHIKVKR